MDRCWFCFWYISVLFSFISICWSPVLLVWVSDIKMPSGVCAESPIFRLYEWLFEIQLRVFDASFLAHHFLKSLWLRLSTGVGFVPRLFWTFWYRFFEKFKRFDDLMDFVQDLFYFDSMRDCFRCKCGFLMLVYGFLIYEVNSVCVVVRCWFFSQYIRGLLCITST